MVRNDTWTRSCRTVNNEQTELGVVPDKIRRKVEDNENEEVEEEGVGAVRGEGVELSDSSTLVHWDER